MAGIDLGVGELSAGWFHVVGEHGDREAPVDKCEGSKEAYHRHILYPTGLNKEEADEQKQESIDEEEPPVAATALLDGTAKGAYSPIYEYKRYEIGEDHL